MRLVIAQKYVARVVSFTGWILFISFFTRFFILEPGLVSGASMEPNFHDGHYFLVIKPLYFFWPPQRFDVVQAVNPYQPDETLLKRVIGLPGETVRVKHNDVCIEKLGQAEICLDEPYLSELVLTQTAANQTLVWKLSPTEYFLLGDNREKSGDSRLFGPIERRSILGQVFPLPL